MKALIQKKGAPYSICLEFGNVHVPGEWCSSMGLVQFGGETQEKRRMDNQ